MGDRARLGKKLYIKFDETNRIHFASLFELLHEIYVIIVSHICILVSFVNLRFQLIAENVGKISLY